MISRLVRLGFCIIASVAWCGAISAASSEASGASVSESSIPVFADAGAGQHQTTLQYRVTANSDAKDCEFYVNAIGKGAFSRGPVFQRWLEAYISVDEAALVARAGGAVENVGMYVQNRDVNDTSTGREGLYLGSRIEPAYYRVKMTYDQNHVQGGGGVIAVRREIQSLAFFLDLRRSDGSIERFWLKNGTRDYTIDVIFEGQPLKHTPTGAGEVGFVEAGPVFNQKMACIR